jgi:multiple sugar transport system substrate-binding protein
MAAVGQPWVEIMPFSWRGHGRVSFPAPGVRGGLLALAIAVLALGLARSGPGWMPGQGAAAKVELSFWNGFTGPDGRVMLQLLRDFNAAHGDIAVTMQRMDWGTYYNKLMVAAVDGRGPEVFVVHASTLPRMLRAGFIDPADDVFALLPISDFDANILAPVRFGGVHVGVPLDVHPQGLYVNADMLRDAGFDRPPATGRELIDYARALQRDTDGDGRPDRWGFSLTMWRWNFCSLAYQYGGRLLGDDGTPTLDSPANIAALEQLVALVRTEKIAPDPENNLGWVGFRQKRIAMVLDGIYMLGDLKRLEGFSYVAAPTPRFGPLPGTHGDSHVLCIRRGISPSARAAAVKLIAFLSDHSLAWADAGQVPARRSVRATEQFRGLAAQSAFAEQLPYVIYPPRTPILFELLGEVDLAVERALRDRMTPAEALRTGQANIERFIERELRERQAPTTREAP